MWANFDTFSATCTVFAVWDNDMLVPQKTNFAYHLFRTNADAHPTRLAKTRINPDVGGQIFISASTSFSTSCFHGFASFILKNCKNRLVFVTV
jgi:hypothetical protein